MEFAAAQPGIALRQCSAVAQEQAILFREFPIVVGHVSQLASRVTFSPTMKPVCQCW